jgi:beta-N-acetylglucosaminidase
MKKIALIAGALLIPVILGFMIIVALLSAIVGGAAKEQSSSSNSTTIYYVKHWSTGDPYTHNLLTHRYGITADQLDGYLDSTGIAYDKNRINGKVLLEWEKTSNVDVRAIVAIAQWESGFGTAGVSTMAGSNMFGYGAFDSNPEMAANYSDQVAINGVGTITILLNKNNSFQIQDNKAIALANGTWNPSMGSVYFTSTSGTGRKRADTMATIDKWIDDHGGTPDPPANSSSGGGVQVLDGMLGVYVPGTYGGGNGQCYAVSAYYAHSINPAITLVGSDAAADIGIAYNWQSWGWEVVQSPTYSDIKPGDIINFKRGGIIGNFTADGTYGHTGVVSQVLGNNLYAFYSQNPAPLGTLTVDFKPEGISSIIHPPKN